MLFNKSDREQITPSIFRKRIKMDGLEAPFNDRTLWLPNVGETLMLITAFIKCMNQKGDPTDANDIALEVNNVTVVPSTVAPVKPGEVLRLAITSQTPFTNALPLTLTQSDAANGVDVLKQDLTLYAVIY